MDLCSLSSFFLSVGFGVLCIPKTTGSRASKKEKSFHEIGTESPNQDIRPLILTTRHIIEMSPPTHVGLICSGDVLFLK